MITPLLPPREVVMAGVDVLFFVIDD